MLTHMSTITQTQTTTITGQPLRDRITQAAAEIARTAPYNMVGMTSSWASDTQLRIAAGGHMNGSVDIAEGSGQATITVVINLTSPLAEGQRPRVEADLRNTFSRYLAGGATAPAGQPGGAPPSAAPPSGRSDGWQAVPGILDSLTAMIPGVIDAFRPIGTPAATPPPAPQPAAPQSPGVSPTNWTALAIFGGVVVAGGVVLWVATRK